MTAVLWFCFIVTASSAATFDLSSDANHGWSCTEDLKDGKWTHVDAESDMTIPSGTNDRIEGSFSPSNIYDTYNAEECRRVRRPWNALSTQERQIYIDGLLELRVRGQLSMDLDELVAIGSVHDDAFGSVTHQDSDYMFWHGYLVWELESRIRNLGGKYKCFGMPYWDFTTEHNRKGEAQPGPYILQTGLGGFGDADNHWTVNGYSWPYSTTEYWSPFRKDDCTAKDDVCPICSLKRHSNGKNFEDVKSAEQIGEVLLDNPAFVDFQRWMPKNLGLPPGIDEAYDPIWFIFHSMESYLQAMWVNCNGYHLINLHELHEHPMAFSPYCDDETAQDCVGINLDDALYFGGLLPKNCDMTQFPLNVPDCVGINLDDALYFGGLLPKKPWSFIHNEKLTIRKLYSLPAWNVVYDLNGDDFYARSGLRAECKDMLSEKWFVLPAEEEEEDFVMDGRQEMTASRLFGVEVENEIGMMAVAALVVGIVVMLILCRACRVDGGRDKLLESGPRSGYGSVSDSLSVPI
eukprot:CAMPEP_0197072662 /NCGR_PEP_ID=MMETSP1384-20130603/210210_1 /TAXON_ID=29189 /ORGANISM="Ammonia sp." /LENGTH=518 /DNA_ID=CAMNT_0042511483 /DNA_START=65 /DNA_END=1621 /DNA_ORIENTATION=-